MSLFRSPLLPLCTAILLLILAACGGGEQQTGVELQVVGPAATRTPPPPPSATPIPTADSASPMPSALTGRLLVQRGSTFELHDLVSGDVTVIAGPRSYSPAFFNHARTHAGLILFPDFGVLDLAAQTITRVRNTGSNPTTLTLSPDGRWLQVLTGQITQRLQVLAADGSVTHNVAASSTAQYRAVWAPDSTLIWWAEAETPQRQRFDPQTGTSTPLPAGDDPLVEPPLAVAPDGARAAAVPLASRPADPAAASTTCFDSYVALYAPPFTLTRLEAPGDIVWSAPGLVASSPHWLDRDRLLFVRLGTGDCGEVQGEPERAILLLDLRAPQGAPQPVAGPLGNADDPNDRTQALGRVVTHLYSPSPDGRFIAWIGGGIAARESTVNLTEVSTGATTVVLRSVASEASDVASFIEDQLFRQVVWLE